jgi:cytochrome c5
MSMKKYVFVLCSIATIMIIACSTSHVQKSETSKVLPPQPMSTLSANELQQGQSIFSSSCARCHDLPEPKKYDRERWTDDILPDMFKKASLDSAQQRLVKGYVISQL